MTDPLSQSLRIAASGLQAQSLRLRVVSENLANSESAGSTPGSDPYRRRSVVFGAELDRLSGAEIVDVEKVVADPSAFRSEFQPGHPAADANGYVKMPNVNPIIELADMKQANRSYEANLQVIRQTRDMLAMTIDLLRGQ
ncbi:flagellar basal body rod protein FlgC [Aestuariivirga sp.]|uniref:flagellar basal body rod protein FlgC n=1 Tax=Aestuariivirga sp. TaxID=2650926 RepID=UPI0039E55E05